MQDTILIRNLGLSDYESTWRAMQAFTVERDAGTPDELWLTEHASVYTLGLNRKDIALPNRDDIPVLCVDRGGKITYHGPGQAVVYLLIDLKRKGWKVRQLVSAMEHAIIALLAQHGIAAHAREHAPGVYVNDAKIASLGLRLRNGCCYHGLALNVNMDLSPFDAIDPCGYRGLQVTQLHSLGVTMTIGGASAALSELLTAQLNCVPASLEIPA